jgi:hypothetical protein
LVTVRRRCARADTARAHRRRASHPATTDHRRQRSSPRTDSRSRRWCSASCSVGSASRPRSPSPCSLQWWRPKEISNPPASPDNHGQPPRGQPGCGWLRVPGNRRGSSRGRAQERAAFTLAQAGGPPATRCFARKDHDVQTSHACWHDNSTRSQRFGCAIRSRCRVVAAAGRAAGQGDRGRREGWALGCANKALREFWGPPSAPFLARSSCVARRSHTRVQSPFAFARDG